MSAYQANQCAFAIQGTLCSAKDPTSVEIIENGLIVIDQNGLIKHVLHPNDVNYSSLLQTYQQKNQLIQLSKGQYLLPGFIDLHVHAPQWPQLGKALHLPLYEWLQSNTFPLEARFSECDFALPIYQSLVDSLLANGTTTAVYFATIDNNSSFALAQICLDKGQRALVGRVAMDDPQQCLDFYRDENASKAIEGTQIFIDKVHRLKQPLTPLVHPVITPRFIPSCSDELLYGLGELTQQMQCYVQTHCSESDWEHQFVKNRFGQTDIDVLNKVGLLTRKTLLAHSNFINTQDRQQLFETGASVAHCPLSNFYFANSVFPLRQCLEQGLHIGLATDISGGHSPSMFDSCRHAITASYALHDGVNPQLDSSLRGTHQAKIDFMTAFWLATAGGGIALDLPVGQLKQGYYFDAIVVDTQCDHSNIIVWPQLDTSQDVLQKIIYNAGRSNICCTWVQGNLVYQK